jgi:hypothetical protein
MGRSLDRRSPTSLVCLNVVSKPHDEDNYAHEGRRTMFQKNNYRYIMYGNDLKHSSPTRDPDCGMRPVAAFANYVCTTEVTQNPDG